MIKKIFKKKLAPPPPPQKKINKKEKLNKKKTQNVTHTHTHTHNINNKKFDEIPLFFTIYKDQILRYQAYNVSIIMK